VAYGYLALAGYLQGWLYQDLPRALGHSSAPVWWPIPLVTLAGVLTGLAIRFLPGRGGHSPAEGFHAGGRAPTAAELPGIGLAALAGLGLGAVIGPEAPLISLGGGLAVVAARLFHRQSGASAADTRDSDTDNDNDNRANAMVAAAGSFAAISALLGSPLLGAFLLMEAVGLGGATLGAVLVPGLLASGLGALIFVGLGAWTGLGTLSLSVTGQQDVPPPTVAQFGWAVVIGLLAAALGTLIRRTSRRIESLVAGPVLIATPLAGLTVGALATLFQTVTGADGTLVLFSGQDGLEPLLHEQPPLSTWVLLALVAAKGCAYMICLGAFRGGPIFPAMFLGVAGGLALSALPGLPSFSAAAMGLAALAAVMLRLPMTAVLLSTLLLPSDGLRLMPLVIVAVVSAYVASAALDATPRPRVRRKPA
jgi:H+/Cl- antiporter ClcA